MEKNFKMLAMEKNYTKLFIMLYFMSTIYEVTSIVGGEDAHIGDFPYIVSLRKLGMHFCGGSILNERWILTANHCLIGFENIRVAASQLTFHVGTIFREKNENKRFKKIFRMIPYYKNKHVDNHEQIFKMIQYHRMPKDVVDHEIALVKVDREIKFKSPYVGSINIANTYALSHGDPVTVAGWGYYTLGIKEINVPPKLPDRLRTVTLNILGKEKCFGYDFASSILKKILFNYYMCTLNRYGVGFSKGDSGGPVVSSSGELVGIMAHSYDGYAVGNPAFHTKVSSYKDWIDLLITSDNNIQ